MAATTEPAATRPAPAATRPTGATGSPAGEIRPEIQGLRAVAVLLVVIYHLWPAELPGGYIGVDVFFVISGFLITSHMLRETAVNGRVHLAAFWARRARRLLPAAYLVLGATALAVAVWVPPTCTGSSSTRRSAPRSLRRELVARARRGGLSRRRRTTRRPCSITGRCRPRSSST